MQSNLGGRGKPLPYETESLRQSSYQGTAVFFQPFAVGSVIRADAFHLGPEFPGVIHMAAVAQLMDHHIVLHRLRAQKEQAVEIQITLGGTL